MWDALVDRDSTTCLPLFAEGRAFFQIVVDYHLDTTGSLDILLSGDGMQCQNFVTIYFERKCFESRKKQCILVEQSTNVDTSNAQCVFRCHTLISDEDEVKVTFMAQAPIWASDSYQLSTLCGFSITRNWPLRHLSELSFILVLHIFNFPVRRNWWRGSCMLGTQWPNYHTS